MKKWTKKLFICLNLAALCYPADAQDKSQGKMELSQCWTFLDTSINEDADSLNVASSREKLPTFLNEYNLDWTMMRLWIACLPNSEGLSYRKAVLDRVKREDVLSWIINSSNPNYDKKYIPEEVHKLIGDHIDTSFPGLPYMELSWRDLARQRLSVLNHRMRMGKYRYEKEVKK